ncbi:vacuolar sorting associated 11, partial [Schistosoma japonicum]
VAANQSSVHQLTMPTLTPSPVIPITTNLSTSSFNQSHIQHDSSITTVPRIVNTFSTAHMPQHFVIAHDTLQSTTSNICGEVTTNVEAGSGVVDVAPVNRVALLNPVSISFGMANVQTVNAAPIQEADALQPSCDQSSRIPPVTGIIDLSAMSDDEENLPELRGDRIETSVNPVDGFSEKSTESNTSVLYEFLCPVTGLGLYVPDNHHQQQQNKQQNNANSSDVSNINQCVDPIVFAASEQSLMSFTVLDRFGVRPHCTTMLLTDDVTGTSPQFAVACPDAVYFYNWDGRGPCLAADGEKIALETYKNYLIILKNTGQKEYDAAIRSSQNDWIA